MNSMHPSSSASAAAMNSALGAIPTSRGMSSASAAAAAAANGTAVSATASGSSSPRPPSIAELAHYALIDLYDTHRDFKYWLKVAESSRNRGKVNSDAGDLIVAFREYARAASLILEKLPVHPEYNILKQEQKKNLGLHGQDILEKLAKIKAILHDRHQRWMQRHPNAGPSEFERSQQQAAAPYREPHRHREHPPPMPAPVPTPTHHSQPPAQMTPQEREEAEWAARRRRDEAKERETMIREQARLQELARREEAEIHQRREEERRKRQNSLRPDTRLDASPRQYKQAQEESHRAQEEGIERRRQESEAAVQALRRNNQASSSRQASPQPLTWKTEDGFLPPLPLESPTKPEYESDRDRPWQHPMQRPLPERKNSFVDFDAPPVTTTSPPPADLQSIGYPALMTTHQRTQGYAPSLQSMFAQANVDMTASALFAPSSRIPYPQPSPAPPPPPAQSHASQQNGKYSQPAPPPRPAKAGDKPHIPDPVLDARIKRATDGSGGSGTPADPVRRDLRPVAIPRETLPRFLAIASVNTARSIETCGLLLGKERGNGVGFIVSSLLVPRQRGSSDTCTMEAEELVMEFTEKRKLLTLGWIHTHPSQSCFMSSIDLHTHSGFQKMLPESFAIVCAPKHTPNFGIFRLTDPPGLNTILNCKAKDSFHPHQEIPIYTDADKGHVQIIDAPLEIIDLR